MKANLRRAAAAVLAVAVLQTACAPSLDDNEPRDAHDELPESFGAPSAEPGTGAATTRGAQKKWVEFFGQPALRALIEQAVENNQEMKIRMQEIIIAQTEVGARQGEYMPKLNAVAGAGVEKPGHYTRDGAVEEGFGLPEPLGNFTFGLEASWEVDVWGKLRDAAKAANYRYAATLEGRNFLITQLVAEIARSYFELIALDNQIEVLKGNLELQEQALEIVRLQKIAARVTQLAVQRFEAEVLANKSRLYELVQQRVEAENRINFLVGRYPQPVARDPKAFDRPLPGNVQAGVPSQLLDNRPDVRRAKLEMEAAKLDVSSAKAAFYPSLTIDAGVGYESFNLEHLVSTPESLLYGVVGRLTAPLLNRAAIKAQYKMANARQLQAVYAYERSLLQAFTDVANQVNALDNLRKSYELKDSQVQTLTESVDISTTLFQAARADYMEVLLTRRDYLDAQLERIETKKNQLMALVSLYQALGGGWRAAK